jgi:opacity protein-like surface antigen
MKQVVLIALVLCLSQPGLAMAQDHEKGFYLKAGVGLVYGQDEDGTIGDGIDPPDKVKFDFGNSVSYQVGIGYKVNNYITMELSLQYNSEFDLEGPYINDGEPSDFRGKVDLETTSVMISGLLDMATILKNEFRRIDINKDWKLRPYIGFGLGYARNKLGQFTFSPDLGENIDGNTEGNFAWKATVGATYPIYKHFAFDASYSYADYGEAKSSRSANDGTYTLNSPLTFDVKAQEFFLSVRYLF